MPSHSQGTRVFLARFDWRNGVAVFDSGRIATNEAGALLDVALGLDA
jgi:hypothetical protein